jgi:hypothetical protein
VAAPNLAAPLIAAIEAEGAQLLDEHKAQIEKAIEPLADNDANLLVSAIASNIHMNGMASMAQAPLRNALTGSEPQLDAIINSNVGGAFDALETLLTNMAKVQAAGT